MADNESKLDITVFGSDMKKLLIDLESTSVRTSEGEVVYLHGVKVHSASRDELTGDIYHVFETSVMRNGYQIQLCQVRIKSRDGKVYTGSLEAID